MGLDSLSALALIGLLAMVSQWIAWWLRLPAILFLLVSGLVAGPAFHLVQPDKLFGDLLFPFVSLSVGVILFEGAMTLKFRDLAGTGSTVRNLVTFGALVTWFITSLAAYYLMHFDIKLAFLFGALVVVTGPTVVVPMLRSVRPKPKIANILRWEGILIDPLGALLAVLAFDFYVSVETATAFRAIALHFGEIVSVGAVLGISAGLALAQLLKRYWIPDYLRSVITLLLVFVVFALAEAVNAESGLLAVTVFGITLANVPDVEIDDILDFKESLSLLLISALFIILAARIDPARLLAAGAGTVALLAVVMFVARPVAVFLSTLGSDLTWREQTLVAWIGPKGIVCAAVASLFELRLEAMGIQQAGLFVPMVFMIIIGTVAIQSLSAKYVAAWLGVRDPAPTGLLIAGAGEVARAIGKALRDLDFKVTLTDSDYENIRAARMEGLDTFYGNPVSDHADRHMDLSGLGRLLAMSGHANQDVLTIMNFRSVFGANNVYELPTSAEQAVAAKHTVAGRYRGKRLFGEEINYNRLAGWLRRGAEIKATTLTEQFGFEEFVAANEGRYVLLFGVDASGRLRVFTGDKDLEPVADWIIVSLILPPGHTISE